MHKKIVIKKQLGSIHSMELQLLFTIFSSKLRLLFEDSFYSTVAFILENTQTLKSFTVHNYWTEQNNILLLEIPTVPKFWLM